MEYSAVASCENVDQLRNSIRSNALLSALGLKKSLRYTSQFLPTCGLILGDQKYSS